MVMNIGCSQTGNPDIAGKGGVVILSLGEKDALAEPQPTLTPPPTCQLVGGILRSRVYQTLKFVNRLTDSRSQSQLRSRLAS